MTKEYFMPLSVNLTGEIRHHYDEESVLPAHELVIRPLLYNSIETFVYRGTKEKFFLCGKWQIPIVLEKEEILISSKGKFKFDQTKECITGHEYLWNATMWKRGSIVIILEVDAVNFDSIFKHTYRPELENNPNTGNTLSATKRCNEESINGHIAVCFSASNGIEYMYVYARGNARERIIESAKRHCQENSFYGDIQI